MAPALPGSSATATSSRRSSTSSNSLPFATPPSSPKHSHSRIPKPSSSSSLASSGIAKARSRSASAETSSYSGSSGKPIVYRADGRVVVSPQQISTPPPTSSSTSANGSRRPSLPYTKAEGREQLVASPQGNGSVESSNYAGHVNAQSRVWGLGLIGGAGTQLPTSVSAPAAGSSATATGVMYTDNTSVSSGLSASTSSLSAPISSGPMQRTTSAEGSSRSTMSVTDTPKAPRRQRSASSLPRRTIVPPRAPVPPPPSDAPAIAVSHATPLRSSRPRPSPSSSSSTSYYDASPEASSSTPGRRQRQQQQQQQRSRGSTPLPPNNQHNTAQPPGGPSASSSSNASRSAAGDRHSNSRSNGIGGRKSTTPRSSAPPSRAASREPSPSRSKAKQRSAQLSSSQSSQSSRRNRGSPASGPPSRRGSATQTDTPTRSRSSTTTAEGPTTPASSSSSRSRIPRRDDSSPSASLKAPSSSSRSRTEATETSESATTPSRTPSSGSHGFGAESSLNHSSGRQASRLPQRSGSSSRQPPKSPSPTSSPRHRKSPGLTISPPAPPMANRRVSIPPPPRSGVPSTDPNTIPPVPAKSPLRALNASTSSSGVASKRQSRAPTGLAPPTSPVPPVPPLPEGLCLAPEPPVAPEPPATAVPAEVAAASMAAPDTVLTPRPSIASSETSDATATSGLPQPLAAISLNSGPPSDSGVDGNQDEPPPTAQPALAPSPQTVSQPSPSSPMSPDQSWSNASQDGIIGSEVAVHGHSEEHGKVPFPESMSDMTLKAPPGTPSPAGTLATLSAASPETSKARLSVSPSSTSAPVTPAASLPGRSTQFGSRPNSEVETISSSDNNFPSTYSPDSAPPSAPASSVNLWAVGARYESSPSDVTETGAGLHIRGGSEHQETLIDGVLWGQKRHSLRPPAPDSEKDNAATTPVSSTFDKALPAVPAGTPRTPKTPQRTGQHHNPSMRSPSLPTMGKTGPVHNGKPVEIEKPLGSPGFPRSQTGPVGLRPPQPSTRPQSMLIASSSVSQSPSPTHMTRRAHLIREIAHTERTHATDLALIRDAYLGQLLRPDSGLQVGSEASSTPPLGDSSRLSRRSSTYGSPIEELGGRRTSGYLGDKRTSGHQADGGKRTSGHDAGARRTSGHERRASGADSAWSSAWNGFMSPVMKSPRDVSGSTVDLNYPSSGAASSTTSIQTSSLITSPKIPSTPSSINGVARLGSAVAKPLSQADVKTIFLNIAALAAMSDALATEFEAALGTLENDSPTPGGEGGTDRLGEAFVKALPRLRPLYTYYCSRQAQASARLLELQNDPGSAAHLNECWAKVKSHTHAWNLDSMLIKPVQRVTKYPLLFEDLLSCTTPVHPDYYAIRRAAEGAKALALEVDEAKRRKDVISSVMSGRSSLMSSRSSSTVNLAKDAKGPSGGRLLRRFKKDKAPSSHDPNALPNITPYAQTQLKDMAKRLYDCERNVRRLLIEIPEWCEASKVLIRQKMEINIYFLKWYALGRRVTNDDRIEKVARFSGVLDSLLTGAWEEMNQVVSKSILLNLAKLQEACRNPLAIVAKLYEKSDEYLRYVAHRQAKKSIDKVLLQEASEYVTIHTQLLEELPAFMEGFTRIYELSLAAFTAAQAKYFKALRDRLALYTAQYLTEPTEMITVGDEIKQVRLDVSTSRGIHKAWIERWREPNTLIKSLQITGGDGSRDTLSRANNLNAGHTSRASGTSGSTRPPSGRPGSGHRPLSFHRSTSSHDAASGLSNRNTSSTKSGSHHSSLEPPGSSRRRSVSLMAAPDSTPGSTGPELRPDSGSLFGSLIRRASHRDRRRESSTSLLDSTSGSSNPSQRSTMIKRPSLSRSKSTATAASARSSAAQSVAEESERLSFGLPRIPTTETKFLFDNLSLDSQKSAAEAPLYTSVVVDHDSTPMLIENKNEPVTYTSVKKMSLSALGLGGTTPPAEETAEPTVEPDVSEAWRDSPVLYSCCAVADFNPLELGDMRFNGLGFLSLVAGDMVDIFHEIGRVAELEGFPYSQVGVDNDGAVIGRSERGQIGVAMCSFLEPLRS